jgi:hypothetical protein
VLGFKRKRTFGVPISRRLRDVSTVIHKTKREQLAHMAIYLVVPTETPSGAPDNSNILGCVLFDVILITGLPVWDLTHIWSVFLLGPSKFP